MDSINPRRLCWFRPGLTLLGSSLPAGLPNSNKVEIDKVHVNTMIQDGIVSQKKKEEK